MSNMSELDLCISELRNAAKALCTVADSLVDILSSVGNTESYVFHQNGNNNVQIGGAKAMAQKAEPITLAQVRAVLAEKSLAGYTVMIQALLKKHGAERLSEIDPSEYDALLKAVEAMGNG